MISRDKNPKKKKIYDYDDEEDLDMITTGNVIPSLDSYGYGNRNDDIAVATKAAVDTGNIYHAQAHTDNAIQHGTTTLMAWNRENNAVQHFDRNLAATNNADIRNITMNAASERRLSAGQERMQDRMDELERGQHRTEVKLAESSMYTKTYNEGKDRQDMMLAIQENTAATKNQQGNNGAVFIAKDGSYAPVNTSGSQVG